MTILEVIQKTTSFFASKELDNPRLQAELLVAHLLNTSRMKLYLQFEREVSDDSIEQLRGWVRRRGSREPLQHITGTAFFAGLEFKSTADALVPRPETEILVEAASKFLNDFQGPKTALDFGTGSGCIAIALTARHPELIVTALDISEQALQLAEDNARKLGVGERIQFVMSDGFTAVKHRQFSLIVSNPPYIPTSDLATLQPEVRLFDPRLALDGGADGLTFYRRLAAESAAFMVPGGRLIIEFGDGQETQIQKIFEQCGWSASALEKDLSGKFRVFSAQKFQAIPSPV